MIFQKLQRLLSILHITDNAKSIPFPVDHCNQALSGKLIIIYDQNIHVRPPL